MSYLRIKVTQHLNEMTTRLSNRPGLLEVTQRLRIELLEYCSISIWDNAINILVKSIAIKTDSIFVFTIMVQYMIYYISCLLRLSIIFLHNIFIFFILPILCSFVISRDAELIPICNRLLTDLHVVRKMKLLFLFGCAKYIRIKMSFIWPMHVLEFRSSVPLCTLVYKRV